MNSQDLSFCIIKPDVLQNNQQREVLIDILNGGFEIINLKKTTLTDGEIDSFYAEHRERSFFPELKAFMEEGECVLLVLKKENCVQAFRDLIGTTDPLESPEGTLRKKYGTSKGRNAVHGSDSNESAFREINLFFGS